MVTSEIKFKINRIDSNLKNLFDEVQIVEKSTGNRFFFEIEANSNFFGLNESQSWNRAGVVVHIEKPELAKTLINWSYRIHPLKESLGYIDCQSSLDTIAQDIYNIVTKKRMDSGYFKKLESVEIEQISSEPKPKTLQEEIINALRVNENLNVTEVKVETSVFEGYEFMTSKPDVRIRLFVDRNLRISERLRIENFIYSFDKVNLTNVSETYVDVNYSQD